MPDEEARALEYRRMMTARSESKTEREKQLSGSAEAVRRVNQAWEPLRRWNGWDPPYTPDDEK